MQLTRRHALAALSASGATLFLPRLSAAAMPSTITAPIAISTGRICGRRSGGVSKFLGIPYGADTSGRRFMPSTAPAEWSGVRDCFTPGHQAPQMESGAAAAGPGADLAAPFVRQVMAAGRQGMEVGNESEDCLFLNVYTPDASQARRRPVMVWLHGGGFAIGSGSDPQYDGSTLARHGDVVVVTLNHRLNALGYLFLGDFDDALADSGNVGQLDIVLALQWVRTNIAALGGDPGNVTIFGESGGGSKVSALLAMPPARGLFHKAIIQSGPGIDMVAKGPATDHALRTMQRLGVARSDVRRLQATPLPALISAASASLTPEQRLLAPVVDGRSLPNNPFDPEAPAISRDVPLMIGTTATEATLFLSADPKFGTMSEGEARQRAARIAGPRGDAAIDLYKRLRPSDPPTYWLAALATDRGTWMDSIRIAERKLLQHAAAVYMYRLDWRTPLLGGAMRSPHGLDVPLVFDNVAARPILLGGGREPQVVADAMFPAWLAFARSGRPATTRLPWRPYDVQFRETMIFNVTSRTVADPDSEVRRFWSAAV